MEAKDKFELLQLLIARNDVLRGGNIARATVIITANAIVIAAISFVSEKEIISSHGKIILDFYSILAAISLLIGIVMTFFSMYYAITGMVNVWGKSRKILGEKPPPRPYYHVHETIKKFKSYSDLKENFDVLQYEDLIISGLSEFYAANKIHSKRYNNMRKASRLLILSVLNVSIAIVATIIHHLFS